MPEEQTTEPKYTLDTPDEELVAYKRTPEEIAKAMALIEAQLDVQGKQAVNNAVDAMGSLQRFRRETGLPTNPFTGDKGTNAGTDIQVEAQMGLFERINEIRLESSQVLEKL
jgi:hypothetical protein